MTRVAQSDGEGGSSTDLPEAKYVRLDCSQCGRLISKISPPLPSVPVRCRQCQKAGK